MADLTTMRQRFASEIVKLAGIVDLGAEELVLEAFSQVERGLFEPGLSQKALFQDVSATGLLESRPAYKPSLLARLMGALGVSPGMKVLVVNPANAYLPALLASIKCKVYVAESDANHSQYLRKSLDNNGVPQVLVRSRPLGKGWEEFAPYAGVIVGCPLVTSLEWFFRDLREPGGRAVGVVQAQAGSLLAMWERKISELKVIKLGECQIGFEPPRSRATVLTTAGASTTDAW